MSENQCRSYCNETIKILEERASVRSFLPDSITEEERQIITSAALRAPNGGKMSKVSFIDVRELATKKLLARMCDNQKFIVDAPGVYIVLADFDRWFRLFRKYVGTLNVDINYPHEDEILLSVVDAMLAAENMVIAAESMGIRSCFIADVMSDYEQMKQVFHLPKYVLPVCMLIMGRARVEPKKPSARINAPIIHREVYQQLPEDRLLPMIEPLIPKDKDGKPSMSQREYVYRYYIRRLGSYTSFKRTASVREMFAQWLKSPFDED